MWSSTASSSSTISIDNKYEAPNTVEIFNDCCKERKFYEPDVQYAHNKWGFNIFEKSLNKPNLVEQSTVKQVKVNSEQNYKDDLIRIWANKNLYNNNDTLEAIYNNEKQEKNNLKQQLPHNLSHVPQSTQIPYIARSQCYPKLMCQLGPPSSILKTNIVQLVHYGIQLFLIDIRYGSLEKWHKVQKHFEKIRKNLNIFGLAVLINGRKLEVGLIYKKQSVYLDCSSKIILTADRRFSNRGTHKVIYVNFSSYVHDFELGDEIKIGNNDEIIVVVEGKAMMSIVCTVTKGGLLRKQMPVKIPFNRFKERTPLITMEQSEDIEIAISMGCDFIISPCVTERLRQHIDWGLAVNNRLVLLLQKFSFCEQPIDTDPYDIIGIFNICDGLYVSDDCLLESYKLQDFVLKTAITKRKVIFQAGFMMHKKDNVFDNEALKCLLLYPDCIVFSPHINDFTNILNTIRTMYPEMNADHFALSLSPTCQQEEAVESVLCRQINLLAACERASCIIVINNSGYFVRLLSVSRTMVPIIASFTSKLYARNCLHCRNVYVNVFYDEKPPSWSDEVGMRLLSCIHYGTKINCIRDNVPFIFCYNSKKSFKQCNTVRILLKNINSVRILR